MDPHLPLLPIVLPLAGAAAALGLVATPRARATLALATMLAATLASLVLLREVWSTGRPMVFQLGAWPAPSGITIVADLLAATLAVMCQLVMCAGLVYAWSCTDRCVRDPAFYPLFLSLATGLTGAILTGDLFNLFVFAELMVISGAALTAIADDRLGSEAACKYFYLSLLASIALLLACGCLYVSYGTLNLADLAQRITATPDRPLLPVAIVLLLVFFLTKSAVVPFHFWQPDFHTAAPTPVSAMLSSVVVKLGVYGVLRMTTLLFVHEAETIRAVLVALGGAGVVFGGLTAIGTHNAKRMLAYSTLAQIGAILVAIGWGTPAALAAAIVITFNHSLIKAALLMLAGAVASRAPGKSAAFADITGLGRSLPLPGALFLLGGMALAGLPPTNGFVGKLALFRSGIEAAQYGALAVLAAASPLTLVYVARAFQRVWWEQPAAGLVPKAGGDRLVAPALLVGLCLVLGVWAEPLLALARANGEWLATPANYVQAVLRR